VNTASPILYCSMLVRSAAQWLLRSAAGRLLGAWGGLSAPVVGCNSPLQAVARRQRPWLLCALCAARYQMGPVFAASVLSTAAAASSHSNGSSGSSAANTVKLAWVGNSYTYFHGLPSLVAQLSATTSPPLLIENQEVTVGGSSLTRLAGDDRVQEMLSVDQDYVVLQDQSQIPGGARPLERDEALLTLRTFYKPACAAIEARPLLCALWHASRLLRNLHPARTRRNVWRGMAGTRPGGGGTVTHPTRTCTPTS
jgi:hypothetical protein